MNDKTPRFESAPARSALPDWYPDLLDRVSTHIATGHRRAVTAANQEMLKSYWSIGREILNRQHEEGLFDFLGTTEGWHERELEQKLVEHVGKFLLELGQGFAFVGEQVRLELDGEEFFCDLLFYHLELRCYVVVELKAVKFNAAFLGQLGLYMAVVDGVLAKEGDKPTIGLLLCRNKKQVVAEYALKGFKAPIGVAEWTNAIDSALPEEFQSVLPSVAELEAELTSED